jgi:hypothetical protein
MLATVASASTADAQSASPMLPTQPAMQTGPGVAPALGAAANSSGGIVTSPVGGANLVPGASAQNLGAPIGWLYGAGTANPAGYTSIPGASVTFTPSGQSPETLQARSAFQTFAGDYGASGSAQQTTGSIGVSSTALTLGSVLDFANGQGVLVAGAGASFTPVSLTVAATGVTYASATATGTWPAIGYATPGTFAITLSASCPAVIAGQSVYDATNGANLGMAVSCSGTTLTISNNLGAGVSASTGASDGLSLPVASTSGSTTYTYAIAVSDARGGIGAAAQAGVTTAPATLTAQNYVAVSITAGSEPGGSLLVWKKTNSGSWYYIGSTQSSTYIDSGLQGFDQSGNDLGPRRPWWAPATPPSSAQNDWLVTAITNGGGTTALTLGTAAQNAVSGAVVYHDDTAALNACVNAGGSSASGSGSACNLPCGVYRTSSALAPSYSNSGFQGARKLCVAITPSGNGDDIAINGTNKNFLRDIYVNDAGGKAAGLCVDASDGNQLDISMLECDHPYSGIRLNNWNNWTFKHILIDRFFSQQGSIIAMTSSLTGQTCCGDMTDVYGYSSGGWGNNSSGSLGDNGLGQVAYLMDGFVATVICRNCDVSMISGDEVRTSNTVGVGGQHPQFIQFSDFGAEFATGWNIDLLAGEKIEFVNGYLHAGNNFNFTTCRGSGDFHVGPQVTDWQWSGGNIDAGVGDNVYVEGFGGQLQGASVNEGSGWDNGPVGQCPGVELSGTSANNTIVGDVIGDFRYPTWQAEPVLLDAGATKNTVVGNSYAGNAISSAVDNSGLTTNVIGLNSGDTAPGFAWDSTDNFFGIGAQASFANNNSYPGSEVRLANAGSAVQSTLQNNAAANNSVARIQMSTGVANAYARWDLNNNSGAPSVTSWIGSGVTGGIKIDASGGGANAPLTLKGGSTAGVTFDVTAPVTIGGTLDLTGPISGGSLLWDSTNDVVGVGSAGTYANNNNYPGEVIRLSGGTAVQSTVTNTASGNVAANYQLSDTAYSNVFSILALNANSGASPQLTLGIGSNVTGGIKIDASGAGSSASLALRGGSAAGVTANPFVQFLNAYTVATLPTCISGLAGALAYVSDALSPSWNATLSGGGSTKTLALCNGSSWTAH